jgi:hypothetical protein
MPTGPSSRPHPRPAFDGRLREDRRDLKLTSAQGLDRVRKVCQLSVRYGARHRFQVNIEYAPYSGNSRICSLQRVCVRQYSSPLQRLNRCRRGAFFRQAQRPVLFLQRRTKISRA